MALQSKVYIQLQFGPKNLEISFYGFRVQYGWLLTKMLKEHCSWVVRIDYFKLTEYLQLLVSIDYSKLFVKLECTLRRM